MVIVMLINILYFTAVVVTLVSAFFLPFYLAEKILPSNWMDRWWGCPAFMLSIGAAIGYFIGSFMLLASLYYTLFSMPVGG